MPQKRVASDIGNSLLSTEYETKGLTPNTHSGFYRDFGSKRPVTLKFFLKFGMDGNSMIFNGNDILSTSSRMEMSKIKSDSFSTMVNIMLGYMPKY